MSQKRSDKRHYSELHPANSRLANPPAPNPDRRGLGDWLKNFMVYDQMKREEKKRSGLDDIYNPYQRDNGIGENQYDMHSRACLGKFLKNMVANNF